MLQNKIEESWNRCLEQCWNSSNILWPRCGQFVSKNHHLCVNFSRLCWWKMEGKDMPKIWRGKRWNHHGCSDLSKPLFVGKHCRVNQMVSGFSFIGSCNNSSMCVDDWLCFNHKSTSLNPKFYLGSHWIRMSKYLKFINLHVFNVMEKVMGDLGCLCEWSMKIY